MKEIVDLIKDLGFPTFVALVLLLRIEPTLKRLELTLTKIHTFMKANSKCPDPNGQSNPIVTDNSDPG